MSDEHLLALPPGTKLHNYRIESVLGQGGFGITYLAHDEALNQKVAIKEFLPGELATRNNQTNMVHALASSKEEWFNWGLTHFLDEARTLASLNHPHIVRVMNFLPLNGTGYMIMEYEQGETLGERLHQKPAPVSEAEIIGLLTPLMDALRTLHKVNLIHRDIKPDNIYLRANLEPVLIDFGAARSTLGGKSQTLAAIVSHGYSPNEQYSAVAKQGPATDIYSLAGVAYCMITGSPPPDAPMRVESHMSGQRDPIIKLASNGPSGYSPSFLAGIDHALEVAQSDRPQNVDAWLNSLGMTTGEHFEAGSNLTDGAHTSPPSSDHLSGQKKRRWLMPAMLVFMALIGGSGYWWMNQQQADLIGDRPSDAFPLGLLGSTPQTIADQVGGNDPGDYISFQLAKKKRLTLKHIETSSDMSYQLLNEQKQSIGFVRNGQMLITELAAGRYMLVLRAKHKSHYQFELAATPIGLDNQPGGSTDTALDLAQFSTSTQKTAQQANYSYDGVIWPHQREHFIKFNLTTARSVTISAQIPASQLTISVNSNEGVTLKSKRFAAKNNLPLVTNLPAGKHYLILSTRKDVNADQGQPLAYRLNVKLSAPAKLSTSGQSQQQREGSVFETAQRLGEVGEGKKASDILTFSIPLDEDQLQFFYRFKAVKAGIITFSAQATTPLSLQLYDALKRNRLAATPRSNKDTKIDKYVEPGEYIVKLSSQRPQTATLSLAYRQAARPGSTKDAPIKLGVVTSQALHHKGTLGANQPQQFHSFIIKKTQQIILASKALDPANETPLELHLSDYKRQHTQQFQMQANTPLSSKMVLEQGRYLIAISSGKPVKKQPYSIEIFALDELPKDESGGTKQSAKSILLVPQKQQSFSGFVGSKDHSDWYLINAAAPLQLTAQLDGLSQNADLLIRDQNGAILDASRLSGLSQERLSWKTDANPVFLEVRSNSPWITPYLLHLQTTAFQQDPENPTIKSNAPTSSGIWKTTAMASLIDGLSKPEALTAAKILARARLVNDALETGTRIPEKMTSSSKTAQLLKSMERAITLDENWDIKWLNDRELQVGLEARYRAINRQELLSASLTKSRFKAMENISLTAKAKKPTYIGLFAWQADGSILRLLPEAATDQIYLTTDQPIKLPGKYGNKFISAPLPGKQQSFEALIVTGCASQLDYTRLAPYVTQSLQTSLAMAVNNRVFIERFANACKDDLSLRVLPYTVYNPTQ